MEAEDLKEVVVQMLQAKISLPADEHDLLHDKHTLESAMAYYSKYGDFSVQYDPGDGADGFNLTHIGGNVNPFLIVGPPALQSSDFQSVSTQPGSRRPSLKGSEQKKWWQFWQ
jgi:hypothetical protein